MPKKPTYNFNLLIGKQKAGRSKLHPKKRMFAGTITGRDDYKTSRGAVLGAQAAARHQLKEWPWEKDRTVPITLRVRRNKPSKKGNIGKIMVNVKTTLSGVEKLQPNMFFLEDRK